MFIPPDSWYNLISFGCAYLNFFFSVKLSHLPKEKRHIYNQIGPPLALKG